MKGNDSMNPLLEYLIVFLIVFIINYFLFIRKKQKYNKNKIPQELFYLKSLYNINIKKINYKKFVWAYSFINTFIISTTYIIVVRLVNGIVWQMIIGIILLILLIIICYGLLGRYYKQKEGKKDV
jgi:purine-cytosine permease-like protein